MLVAEATNGLAGWFEAAWSQVVTPIVQTPWADWSGFWLTKVLDDRFVVIWFLPLVLVLLLAPRRYVREAVLLTGLVFIAYLFGAAYALFWVLLCVLLHRFAEHYAHEAARTDVWRHGPTLGAIFVITAGFCGTQLLQSVPLPAWLNDGLLDRVPWLFPYGWRGALWEPVRPVLDHAGNKATLLGMMFYNAHSIGTAYLAVRMLAYLSQIKRGEIPRERRTLLNFLAYTCYAPALIQGPIERYEPFLQQLAVCHDQRSVGQAAYGLWRVAIGINKGLFNTWYVGPLMWYGLGVGIGADDGASFFKHPERVESTWLLYGGIFLWIFALYLEFSGYCDVVVGIGRLFGYRQAENFDKPWLATSFRDFWRRWHITLSFILRDYVYIALGGNRRRLVFNLCITFVVCGVWHALIPKVALWGVLMGLMVVVNHYWHEWARNVDATPSHPLYALRQGWLRLWPLPQICAWLLTVHAFCFSLLLFAGGSAIWRVPAELWRRLLG